MINEEQKEALRSLDLRAFLFDMDGVLYDSMPHHALAWIYAFKQVGIEYNDYEVYLHEGMTGDSTIEELYQKQLNFKPTKEECKRVYKIKADYFESIGPAKEMPGALSILTYLKEHNVDRFIVTGSGQQSLFGKLDHSFSGMFVRERMVTAFDVKKGKPDPEPYLMALQKGGLKQNQAIVVENAPLGVRAGVAAGVFTIAVNTGILKDEELLNEKPNMLYPSMQSLYEDLPKIIELAKK